MPLSLRFESLDSRELLAADVLYIADGGTDSVQSFDASTGEYLGEFVAPAAAGLHGPGGMIFNRDSLLVVNQNVNTPFNGEVLRYDSATGAAQIPFVSQDSAGAPFAPRGVVIRDNVIYVADFEGTTHPNISKFDAATGAYIGELVPTGFDAEFRPRGLVFGPDGGLFVTVFSEGLFESADPPGYVLRFDIKTGASRVVAWNDGNGVPGEGEVSNLHNPEGITFSPNGSIYVTSNFGSQTTENTHIIVIDPATGHQLNEIELDPRTLPENPTIVVAQAFVFGPSDKLFIPLTTVSLNDGVKLGGLWTYDPATDELATFIAPSLFAPVLQFPEYLTFQQTNPATLAYQPWHNFHDSLDVDRSSAIVPRDVLLVINELNHRTVSTTSGKLQRSRGTSEFYFDVSGDGFVTPIDALLVINYLNRPADAALVATARPQSSSTATATETLGAVDVRFAAAIDGYFSTDSRIARRETANFTTIYKTRQVSQAYEL
ncbi:MAG: hypothetical protein KDB27_14915 [Planctomycetales bacterium]|nr:hypothetical protein [Planctomycetales bacterium]